MTMSMMRRTAPLGLLCYGVHNGGGAPAITEPLAFKCEEELDGYTEEIEPRGSMKPADTHREELQKDTIELLTCYYRSYVGLPTRGKKHRAVPTLNRVVQDLRAKHGIAFTGILRQLLKDPSSLERLGDVVMEVFSDSVVNWGRIGTVLALGALVCEQLNHDCVDGRADESVDAVASQISTYLSTHQYCWFNSHDGWDGFVKFFQVCDPEAVVRNTLAAVVGFAGLGACLISLAR